MAPVASGFCWPSEGLHQTLPAVIPLHHPFVDRRPPNLWGVRDRVVLRDGQQEHEVLHRCGIPACHDRSVDMGTGVGVQEGAS